MEKITINTDFITLGQVLKLMGLVSSGGEVKYFLKNNKVLINNELENRRGKKIYPNDTITLLNTNYLIIKDEN